MGLPVICIDARHAKAALKNFVMKARRTSTCQARFVIVQFAIG